MVESVRDVVLGDLVLLPEGIEGLHLGNLLDQRELLLGHLSHLDSDHSACHLANLAHLDRLDVLKDVLFREWLVVGPEFLSALCPVEFNACLLHRLGAFGVVLGGTASLVVKLWLDLEFSEDSERGTLLGLLLVHNHHLARLSIGLLVARVESRESISFAFLIDLLGELDLALDHTLEYLDVLFPVHLSVDTWGGIDVAHVSTHLLDDSCLLIRRLERTLHLLHLSLGLLLTGSQVGSLALLNVIVVLKVVLSLGTLKINQLDSVLQVKLIHNLGALNQDNDLCFLLAARLEGCQFLLALKLKLNFFHQHCLGDILADVFLGLTGDSLTLVILLNLL